MRRLPFALALVALAACDRAPSPSAAREWTAQDHDKAEQSKGSGPRGSAKAAPQGPEQLAELAWQQNCAQCHGAEGHGDGPNGPLTKAPDLTRADWLAKTSDADIAARIQQGKGMMPKFELPPTVIGALVARIRAFGGR